MPDHAHEGLCVPEPNPNATKQFSADLEYPAASGGGDKPVPEIIAYGSNLSGDEWNFCKDRNLPANQPARNDNPMIAVYDGWRAGVGRVATDSTWHHWMDVNIAEIRAADNDDWKKISRYYINLALWLDRPGGVLNCFVADILSSHFTSVGFQEFSSEASAKELGASLRAHLVKNYGHCWVSDLVWQIPEHFKLLKRKRITKLTKSLRLSAVDAEYFDELVLGEIVKLTMPTFNIMKQDMKRNEDTPNLGRLFGDAFASAFQAVMRDPDLKISDKERGALKKALSKLR